MIRSRRARLAHIARTGSNGPRFPPFARRRDLHCDPTKATTFCPTSYGTDQTPVKTAKRLCRHCPAADECLLWALTEREPEGIWGGYTPREREALTKGRRV